ncbi:MAG: hypothetical protein IJ416_05250 [Ruminiclostridium sp.]|nr:hypothetical protein [Ruminiclostridium sp.]
MATTLNELIGKTVLVGIAHVDEKGKLLGRSQYFGTVVKADPKEGVVLARHGINDFSAPLPPFPEQYIPAKKGIYTLQSNGMKVKDPDYTCTWKLRSTPIDKK